MLDYTQQGMLLKSLLMTILMNSVSKSLSPFGRAKDSVSNNSSLRTEGTPNNLFCKSTEGKDPPGKFYKPLPNRNNHQTI